MNDTLPGSGLTLRIDALSHDGRGIARPDGGRGVVFFVAGALPGQTVRARVLRRKASFAEAEALDVTEQAPGAVPPHCPHHEHCGGCPLQTMPYAGQLRWKERMVLDALTRIGGLPGEDLAAVFEGVSPSPALRACRNKMEFAFGLDHGAVTVGLRRRGGREVAAVPGCALLPPQAGHMAALAAQMARLSALPPHMPEDARAGGAPPAREKGPGNRRRASGAEAGFWRFLVLRRGLAADLRSPRWWALCITSPGGTAEHAAVRRMGRELLAAFPDLAAFIHEERAAPDAFAAGQRRVAVLNASGRPDPAAARMHLPLGGRHFTLDAGSFFQVNTAAAQTLARLARDMLLASAGEHSPGRGGLLDLYCGVGAPGLLAAPGFTRVLGLEQDAGAVALARRNAARMGLDHCRYVAKDAARLPREAAAPGLWTAALADPPRAGLSPGALAGLLAAAPERIVYISCNPATLARDAARIREHYALERLAAVDLFPHTPHVECLSLWRRAG